MDQKAFGYFNTLLESKSYAAAARILGITPQGLSSSVRRFEAELGVPLVTNVDGLVRPTIYGEQVSICCHEVNESLTNMKRALATLKAHERGIIRVGCVTGSLGFLGEGFFEEFGEVCIGSEVLTVPDIDDAELERELLRGDHDFALLLNPSSTDFIKVPILRDQSFIWVNKKNPLAQKSQLSAEDLRGQTVMAYAMEYNRPNPIQRALTAPGSDVKIVFTGEMMRIYEAAYNNHALGLTSRNHIEQTQGPLVVGLPFKGLPIEYHLCYRCDRDLTEVEQEFVAYAHARQRLYPAK